MTQDSDALIAEMAELLKDVRDGVGCQPGYINTIGLRRVNAMLAKLQPPAPEPDEATKVWREMRALGQDAVVCPVMAKRHREGFYDERSWAKAEIAYLAKALEAAEKRGRAGRKVPEDQIKQMVDRFLGWRLPEDFRPDDGISFEPEFNKEYNAAQGKPPQRRTPTGTNLFTATQADAMVRYMLEGLNG